MCCQLLLPLADRFETFCRFELLTKVLFLLMVISLLPPQLAKNRSGVTLVTFTGMVCVNVHQGDDGFVNQHPALRQYFEQFPNAREDIVANPGNYLTPVSGSSWSRAPAGMQD